MEDAELVDLLESLELGKATTNIPANAARSFSLSPAPAMPVSLYNIHKFVGGQEPTTLSCRVLHDSVGTPGSLAFVLLYLGDQPSWNRHVMFTNERAHLIPCDTRVSDFAGRSYVTMEVDTGDEVPVFARLGAAISQQYDKHELCWAPIGMGRINRVAVFPEGSNIVEKMQAQREERHDMTGGTWLAMHFEMEWGPLHTQLF
jgi:hypothetical protein